MHGDRDGRPQATRRIPPQSVEAEEAVLGGLMLRPMAWVEVMDRLTSTDFFRYEHQLIWLAIKEMMDATPPRPIDPVTLGDWFESQGLAHHVAGGAYLVQLSSSTPSAANIAAYADIVADKSQMRRMIEIGTDLVNAAFQPEGCSSLELIGQAQTRMAGLLVNQPCELEPMGPIMLRVFDNLQERYTNGTGGVTGKSTGLTELDVLINGLKPGLYIVAARPKQGKTTLAQNIAEHFALIRKEAVAIFTFEMQPEELGDRMLSSVGDIDGDRVRRGTLDDVDWSNVTAAVRKLRGARIHVSRPRNATIEHVSAQARRQHARQPLGVIIVDYLQLMDPAMARGETLSTALGRITRGLKMLSDELLVPVVLLSQLSRKVEERQDKRPVPSDLRDSGAIEQDADVVIFLYRDDWYNAHSPDRGTAEIIVALQRNGPQGMVRVKYTPSRFRFEDLPDGWEPEPMPEKPKRTRAFRKKPDHASRAAGDDS
jgi:replicative DNA helicase